MFCLYFSDQPMWNVDDVKRCDFDAFRRFFWAALDEGVYFAPSQYEAGFLSLAHSEEDIARTAEVTASALAKTFGV